MREKLFEELKALVPEVLPDIDTAKMTMTSNFKEDLGLDSLNMVVLAVAIENKYGFRFDATPKMDTVSDLIDYILPRIPQPSTPAGTQAAPRAESGTSTAEPEETPAVRLVRSAKIIHIVASALLFLSGIFVCIWGGYTTVVQWVVGAIFILMGAASMLGYFSNDLYRLAFNHDLAIGAFSVMFGGMCWLLPYDTTTLTYAVCIYVILDGFTKLQVAIEAKTFGMQRWHFMLGTAILVVGMGIVAFIILIGRAEPRLLTGLALSVDGAENIWNTVYTVKVKAGRAVRHD